MYVSLCHKNVWLESKVFSLICSLRTTVIPTKSERKCSIKLFACLKIYGQNMTQKAVDSELRVRHTANGSEQWLQSFRTDRRNRKRISNPFVAVIYHWIVSNSNLFRHDLCSKKNDTRIVFGICWAFGRSGRTKHLKNSCIRVNYCSEKLLHSLSLSRPSLSSSRVKRENAYSIDSRLSRTCSQFLCSSPSSGQITGAQITRSTLWQWTECTAHMVWLERLKVKSFVSPSAKLDNKSPKL